MELKLGNIDNIKEIQAIADIAFPNTYRSTLPDDQLVYMMDMMYSDHALSQQMQQGQKFCLLYADSQCEGFVSYEHDYKGLGITKLHKLYLLPASKGRGWGRMLVEHVFTAAAEYGNKVVQLNMNRNNTTYGFYLRMGFSVVGSEDIDIDIGKRFLMEDYIFEKSI